MSGPATLALPISTIVVGPRFRRYPGDLKSLANSIDQIGLLQPIVVDREHRLIAGLRRLRACQGLGWNEVPARVVDVDALLAECHENTEREPFLPSEAVAIGAALAEREREKAEQRMKAGRPCGKLPQGESGKSRDKVGRIVGLSGRTWERAVAVVEAAAREPEKFGPLVEEMDHTGRVSGVWQKLVVARKADAIESQAPGLPPGRYHAIVADPPWAYDKRRGDPSHVGTCPYPDMTNQEIRDLEVSGMAATDCILWLWTTNAHLPVAFGVMEAWGFTYKTTLTWVKQKFGIGVWLRGQTEHCLMGVRGSPVVLLKNQTTALSAPAGEHSAKPDEFYALVESLCPGKRAELFQRKPRAGWTGHGDEVPR